MYVLYILWLQIESYVSIRFDNIPSVSLLKETVQIPCQQMYIRAHLLAASFCKAKTSLMYGTTDIPVRSDMSRINFSAATAYRQITSP